MLLSVLCLMLTLVCMISSGSAQSVDSEHSTANCQGAEGCTIRGDEGDTGEPARTRKSAFTAIKTSYQSGDIGDVITFQETPTNINSHFDLATSKFTCQIPGTYVFMFAIGLYQPHEVMIYLVKNGDQIVSAHTRTGGFDTDFDQSTNAAILNLEDGDQVWLEFAVSNGQLVSGSDFRYDSFSGFLLY